MISVFEDAQRHCIYWRSSKGPHHQQKVLCKLVGAVMEGYQNKTSRKIDEIGFVLSGQCSSTQAFSYNGCYM